MTYKATYLTILAAIFFACNTPGTEGTDSSETIKNSVQEADKESRESNVTHINNIESIQTEYDNISQAVKNGTMKQTSFKFDCHGEKTGQITFYRENDKIRMIEKKYNEFSHRDAIEQYFIANEKPFFIYYKISDWSFEPGSAAEGATKSNVKEKRYYIAGNELIRCLEKAYTVHSATEDSFNPDEIASKNINCPGMNTLLDEYKKLMSYKDQTTATGCLE